MSRPTRRLVTGLIFRGMARTFDRERGAGLDAVVRWEVGPRRPDIAAGEKTDVWHLLIHDGRARARRRSGEPPRTTIGLDHLALLDLVTGNLNAPKAFLTGRLRMSGDVMLAQRLSGLFGVPGARD